MRYRFLITAILLLAIEYKGQAQEQEVMGYTESEFNDDMPAPQLFDLNPRQYNHRFTVTLPDDGLLRIDFLRISDWGEKNQLLHIADIAANQANMLRDSFKVARNAKKIALNVPVDEKVISVSYQDYDQAPRKLAWKDGEYYDLKTTFDTIVVVRNIGVRERPLIDSGLIQIKYTFILKSLDNIDDLVKDPSVLETAGNKIDSTITAISKKWRRKDADFHTVYINYRPGTEKEIKTYVEDGPIDAIFNRMGMNIGFGGIMYHNIVSPYFDLAYAYLIPGNNKIQGFIGVNLISFLRYKSDMAYDRTYASINLEFGLCKAGSNFIHKKTSLFAGIMYTDFKGQKPMFSFGVNYGVTSYLSAGMIVGTNFKEDKDNNIIGINFKFNL